MRRTELPPSVLLGLGSREGPRKSLIPRRSATLPIPTTRVLLAKDGFIQGYNAQAAVDGVAQVIVGPGGSTPSRAINIELALIADAIRSQSGQAHATVG